MEIDDSGTMYEYINSIDERIVRVNYLDLLKVFLRLLISLTDDKSFKILRDIKFEVDKSDYVNAPDLSRFRQLIFSEFRNEFIHGRGATATKVKALNAISENWQNLNEDNCSYFAEDIALAFYYLESLGIDFTVLKHEVDVVGNSVLDPT